MAETELLRFLIKIRIALVNPVHTSGFFATALVAGSVAMLRYTPEPAHVVASRRVHNARSLCREGGPSGGRLSSPTTQPSQYRGPGPRRPARSAGFASSHLSIDRHPHPMHCVSPALRRCSSAIL